MQVFGIDFTSAPGRRKAIVVARCRLNDGSLLCDAVERLESLSAFDRFLTRPGPWIAGCDFPFSQPRRLAENVGWPVVWADFVARVAGLDRSEWRQFLENYKANRPAGDREHPRAFERGTGAASPQKLYGVPVAMMYFEGARRLRDAGVDIPGLALGDTDRRVVEAYPGMAARALAGRAKYKTEGRDQPAYLDQRRRILQALKGAAGAERFGISVRASDDLADDASGDALDALICAVQAAWAQQNLDRIMAALPVNFDPFEGWIADPDLFYSGP